MLSNVALNSPHHFIGGGATDICAEGVIEVDDPFLGGAAWGDELDGDGEGKAVSVGGEVGDAP